MIWKIPLAKPDITDLERNKVMEVLETSYLSLGPKLEEFERKIAKYIGVKYAVGVNSGTSALHLIIRALGIKAGDEVITTPFSFIASANCILFEKAKPVFVDIQPHSLNINPELIEAKITAKTRAILAVDVFGYPADWDKLSKIAKKHKLFLIEDSAEALGSEYKNKKCGSFGDAAVFGFYPNKQITTGEGGAVVTNNKKIADLCRSMRNQGRDSKVNRWLVHRRLGYNYRLSELNCALGIAQLARIQEIIKRRNRVARMYSRKLKNIEEIDIPYIVPDVKIDWFVYAIRLKKGFREKEREQILKSLYKKGIECGIYFPSIHLQPFYRKIFGYKKGDFPITESVSERSIALPFYNNLREKEINYIVDILTDILKKIN